MAFNIKILLVTIICALSIIGCNGTGKRIAKWPIEKNSIKEGDIKFDLKNKKLLLGPNWKVATKEDELDLTHAKGVLTAYYMALPHDKDGSGDEDPSSHCKVLVIPIAGATLYLRFPPGCH